MNRIHRPAACPDFLEVFSDFVDGTLPPDREGEIRAHLDCCEGCLRHLAAYRRGVMALRAQETEVDPRAFWTDLERRLWTEGHLAGGREPARRGGAWWSHPAAAMAAAACFAVVVFFAGMWGDRALHRADGSSAATASVAGAPIVLESEPIELAGTPLEAATGEAGRGGRGPRSTAAASAAVPIVRASLEGPAPIEPPAVEPDPVERASEVAYVASLEREAAASEAIERARRLPVEGLRGAWSRSAMTADGWIEPVALGTAGIRRLQARAPVTAWPVEAALSLP